MDLVARAAPYLAQHGSQSPRLDAELLLAQALGCTRLDLYLQFERPLSSDQVDRYRALCRRRAGGEPVAYIRGLREFMTLTLVVTPAVMIPRPETEILDVARLNRERLDMQDRVELRQADLVDGVDGPFDLVLANLPYIDPDWPDA